MAQVITFRPDSDTERALKALTADGTPVSEAIRSALVEAAVTRRRQAVRAESEALAADPDDRAEIARVLADMESLRAGRGLRLKAPRVTRGHEQSGPRFGVVVQSDDLHLSTWLVAPTSTSARPAVFRPQIDLSGQPTLVLVEQTTAVDPQRLGPSVGSLSVDELALVDAALRITLAV